MSSSDANTEVALLKEAKEWEQCKGSAKVKIVITGMTGAGKSALANSLTSSKPRQFLEGDDTASCTTTSKRVAFGMGGDEIVVWDTPGFTFGKSENERTLNDIKLKVIGKGECDVLLYAIDMDKSRFTGEDINITVMGRLTETFNQAFWMNAVIVLTKANLCIGTIKDSFDPESSDCIKKRYTARQQEWEKKIRDYLESKILPKELVQNIQITTAGYHNQSHLETEPRETSWIHDMWFSILHAAKSAAKPVVLRVLLHKIFEEELINGVKLVHFITSHQHIYQQRILDSGIQCSNERKKIIGFICNFLNLQEIMLKNIDALQHVIKFNESGDHTLLNYWKKVSSSVDIMVAGGLGSGKTSLINSLFFGRKKIDEGNDIHPGTTKAYFKEFKHEEVTCCVWDTPGLQYLEDIRQNYNHDKLGLFLFCISILEDRMVIQKNLENITSILGKEVWQHAVIVLTFANITDQNYISMVESWTDFIEKQLRSVTDQDNESSRRFKIVPAGYHKNKFVSGDPKKKYWVVNLWMEMVSEAKTRYQPALVQLLLNIFSKHLRSDRSMEAAFIHQLIELLHIILKDQKLIIV